MKKLEETDLQIGDILIFENNDFSYEDFYNLTPKWNEAYDKEKWKPAAFYLLLYMIPWFDPGEDPKNYKNIYHAAIWGNVNVNRDEKNLPTENQNRIVQAGTHGIGQAELDATLRGPGVKNIYVYRYKGKDAAFQSNINTEIRKFYNNTSIKYSYETAWLLAVICSMRYSDGAMHKILKDKIGEWAANFMIGIIQDLIGQYSDDNQQEMVACSTLVAMIYKDAKFPLKIKDSVKDQPLDISLNFDKIEEKSTIKELKDKNIPKVTINNTVVTPRQLLESNSVEEVGCFPFRG
mgnify:CR=1 FL=1